jgi:hypothetical protein
MTILWWVGAGLGVLVVTVLGLIFGIGISAARKGLR